MARLRTSLPVAALLLALTGCSGAASLPTLPLGNNARSIDLRELRRELSPYQDQERYDFISDEHQYAVIGARDFDQLFFQSALLASRLQQARETSAHYDEGQFDLQDGRDVDFLLVMTAEVLDALPGIVGDARGLLSQLSSLDVGRLSTLQKLRAAQGIDQARANLLAVIESAAEVDEMLDDYQALVDDLDAVEAEDVEAGDVETGDGAD